MTMLYTILRVIAYAAGLTGMVLFVTAQQGAEAQPIRATLGGGLLIASFVCFLATYVLYLIIRLGRLRKQ